MKIGNGEFLNCDAMEQLAVMPGGSVDCIVTDPPYRVISGGIRDDNKTNGYARSVVSGIGNGKIFEHNDIEPEVWVPQIFRVLKPQSHAYVMTNNLNLERMLRVCREAGFRLHNVLIWEKNNVNANRWYMKNVEFTLFMHKAPAKTINNPGSKQTFKADNPRNKTHPTEKPIALMSHYIENSTAPGDVVFDPFAGSGTTAVAAELAGRKWLCVEKDLGYYLGAVGRVWGAVNGKV